MTTKTEFIDTSHWEGVIDWDVTAQHTNGNMSKATEGEVYEDVQFKPNVIGCTRNGTPWTSYHFFRPGRDPVKQANFHYAISGDGSKVHVADLETSILEAAAMKTYCTTKVLARKISPQAAQRKYRGMSKYPPEIATAIQLAAKNEVRAISTMAVSQDLALWERAGMFLDRIETLTGHIPWVYSSPAFVLEVLKPPDWWGEKYPLHIAHYYVDNPIIPRPWVEAVAHQYTDKGTIPGIIGYVDKDWYYGTPGELRETFGNGGIPQPPPLPEYFTVKNPYMSYVNVRDRPNPSNDQYIIGRIYNGKKLQPIDSVIGTDGKYWWRFNEYAYLAQWLTIW